MTIKPVQKKVIIFLVVLAVFFSLLSKPVIKHFVTRVTKFNLTDDYPTVEDSEGFVYYNISRAERDNLSPMEDGSLLGADQNYFVIEGWAGLYGESVETFNTAVLLQKDDKSICYKIATDMVTDDSLANYENTGFDYKYGSFVGRVDSHKLQSGNYRIVLLYKNDGHDFVIYTDNYIEVI